MANPLDLDALTSTITAQIAAQFPALKTVEFDRIDRANMPMPACILDLDEMEADVPDPGTDQLAVMARFEARLVVGFKDRRAKQEVRKLAAAFATWMHLRSFGPAAPSRPAKVIALRRDDFHPILDEFEVWCVEWHQEILLGADVWENYAVVPTPQRVFIGQAPDIGLGHEGDYTQVVP
jgi:hypothetical protein